MRFVYLTEVAYANIQACGVWLHCRGTIVGLFPEWWWDEKDRRQRTARNFRLGLKLWARDSGGRGVRTIFGLYTSGCRIKYSRAVRGRGGVRSNCASGWSLWRAKARPSS